MQKQDQETKTKANDAVLDNIPLRHPNDPIKQADHVERVLRLTEKMKALSKAELDAIGSACSEILNKKRKS